ncbi:MAG: hypothetical protein SFU91_13480 [Chloroherpetonaceae bacterium]|nr:hypothetical protein [Chloroherpetonaceae bacterium]
MTQVEKKELISALKEVLIENKPLLKELLKEIIDENHRHISESRDEKVNRLIQEHLVRYEEVWKALA